MIMQNGGMAEMRAQQEQLQLFHVESVAIVGVSEEDGRIGSGLYKSTAASFPGKIFCVNPKYDTIWGRPCYKSVLELPEAPSHAVIAVARKFVLDVVRQCADKGIKNVVVISAGFKETDDYGAMLEMEMAALCREKEITLLGPNTLGFIDTSIPYNGTFLPEDFPSGTVSVISQSGGVGISLLSALQDQGCGVNKWVGIGNEAVVDAVCLLRYFAQDPTTKAIAVCFEGLKNLPGFLREAEQVNKTKPIVLLRDGKGSVGMKAAASHTGTMATDTAVMSGLVEQFGLTEAKTTRECAAMLKALSLGRPSSGDRAVLLTNTAGPSILAADALEPMGVMLPMPSDNLRDAIDEEAGVAMKLKNPADISSNGLSPRNYGIAARRLLGSEEFDIFMGFFSLSNHLILPDKELVEAVEPTGKSAVACFLGTHKQFDAYDRMPEKHGVPCYCDPYDGAAAVAALVNWGKAQRRREEKDAAVMTAEQLLAVEDYLDACQGGTLSELESRLVLMLAGMDVDVPAITTDAADAARAAARCGYPVALKIDSERITHKSDVGGVRMNIQNEEELLSVYDGMLSEMRKLDADAKLTVQKMQRPGLELILGGVRRAGTGPLIMCGMGGVYSEVMKDAAFRMAPVREGEPERMLSALRCAPILDGFRGEALDKAAAARNIAILSQLMDTFPRIREIDINPCRMYESGCAVLDARIVLDDK